MRLAYHRGDSDYSLKDYVYLWNFLEEALKVNGVGEGFEVLTDSSPYEELTRRWRELQRKGLKTPKEEFGRGGKWIATTLFLKTDQGAIRYYWHGRASVQDALKEIVKTKGENLTRLIAQ